MNPYCTQRVLRLFLFEQFQKLISFFLVLQSFGVQFAIIGDTDRSLHQLLDIELRLGLGNESGTGVLGDQSGTGGQAVVPHAVPLIGRVGAGHLLAPVSQGARTVSGPLGFRV